MQDVPMTHHDSWHGADAYQRFMGRWSPYLAELFVPWLGVPAGRDWLDVGLRAQKSARGGVATRLCRVTQRPNLSTLRIWRSALRRQPQLLPRWRSHRMAAVQGRRGTRASLPGFPAAGKAGGAGGGSPSAVADRRRREHSAGGESLGSAGCESADVGAVFGPQAAAVAECRGCGRQLSAGGEGVGGEGRKVASKSRQE